MHPRLYFIQVLVTCLSHRAVATDEIQLLAQLSQALLEILGCPVSMRSVLELFWAASAAAAIQSPITFPQSLSEVSLPGNPAGAQPATWNVLIHHKWRGWLQNRIGLAVPLIRTIVATMNRVFRPFVVHYQLEVSQTLTDLATTFTNLQSYLEYVPVSDSPQEDPVLEVVQPGTPQRWHGNSSWASKSPWKKIERYQPQLCLQFFIWDCLVMFILRVCTTIP